MQELGGGSEEGHGAPVYWSMRSFAWSTTCESNYSAPAAGKRFLARLMMTSEGTIDTHLVEGLHCWAAGCSIGVVSVLV